MKCLTCVTSKTMSRMRTLRNYVGCLTIALALPVLLGGMIQTPAGEPAAGRIHDDPELGHDMRYLWVYGEPRPYHSGGILVFEGTVLPDATAALLVNDDGW